MTGNACLAAAVFAALLTFACSDEGQGESSFALPSACIGKCDGSLAQGPTGLDVVNLELDETGEQRVTLAWEPAAEESEVVEYWVARGRPPATEANLVTRVPKGFAQVAVSLRDESTDYFVASIGVDNAILGVSEAVRVHQTARGKYSFPGLGPRGEALSAHTWSPLTGQEHPFAILLHGNHSTCSQNGAEFCASAASCEQRGGEVLDNAAGYDYVGRALAAKGFVVISVDANDLNCQFGLIEARAELILEHIRSWRTWQQDGGYPGEENLAARVDLSHVGLFGHSRGGEAVVVATQLLAEQQAEFAYVERTAVLSLAPTDFDESAVVEAPLLMVLPGCDGDVEKLKGQDIWSRSAGLERTSELHQVVVPGANHNFFNREWLSNDSSCAEDAQLERASHEASLVVLMATWFDSKLGDRDMPDASRGGIQEFPRINEWAGVDTDLRWSYAAPGSLVVEAADSPQVSLTNELGGANEYLELSSEVLFSPARRILSLFWDSSSSQPTIRHELLGLDASAFAALSFRVAAEVPDAPARESSVDAVLRIRDSQGQVAELTLRELGGLYAQSSSGEKLHVPQTIRVPVEAVLTANPELDWSSLASFEVDVAALGSSTGIWQYSDVELVP